LTRGTIQGFLKALVDDEGLTCTDLPPPLLAGLERRESSANPLCSRDQPQVDVRVWPISPINRREIVGFTSKNNINALTGVPALVDMPERSLRWSSQSHRSRDGTRNRMAPGELC